MLSCSVKEKTESEGQYSLLYNREVGDNDNLWTQLCATCRPDDGNPYLQPVKRSSVVGLLKSQQIRRR